jgi:hypothetical protein
MQVLPLGQGSVLTHSPSGVCGHWQHKYSSLHKDILAGRLPARFAVHVSPRSGFSDRLVGMVSVFFYALLTERAIIFWRGPDDGLPQVGLAFEGPHINWTASEPYKDWLGPIPEGLFSHPDSAGPSWRHWDMLAGSGLAMYDRGDLLELGREVRTVLQTMHRGKSVALFSNPHTAARLYGMGLRPETAFGCALNYLFRPHAGIQRMFKRELAVLTDPSVFTIGLQIRCGSRAACGNNSTWVAPCLGSAASPDLGACCLRRTGDSSVLEPSRDRVDAGRLHCFVHCAEQVEQHWVVGNASVAWYVVSDSVHVRRRVEALHGAKVVTRTDLVLEHTAAGVDPDVIEGQATSNDGFRAALWCAHAPHHNIATGAVMQAQACALRCLTQVSVCAQGAVAAGDD